MAQSAETRDAEQRMLGTVPGEPATGRGPSAWGGYSRHPNDHPAARVGSGQ